MYNNPVCHNVPKHLPNHPLYKTRICRHWLRGHCRLANCNFKHGWYDKPPVVLTRSTSVPVIKTSITWGKEAPLSQSVMICKDDELIQDFVVIKETDYAPHCELVDQISSND